MRSRSPTRSRPRSPSCEPLFPDQLKTYVSYDTTPFVSASIEKVVKTLVEAMCWSCW
jgi:multidrug efflux pump subunit AcrB